MHFFVCCAYNSRCGVWSPLSRIGRGFLCSICNSNLRKRSVRREVPTLFIYYMAHRGDIYVDPARAALHNPGNMCYLNSMLHVLARTPSIRNWAVQHRALNTGRTGHQSCTLCDLGDDLRLYSSIRFGIL